MASEFRQIMRQRAGADNQHPLRAQRLQRGAELVMAGHEFIGWLSGIGCGLGNAGWLICFGCWL